MFHLNRIEIIGNVGSDPELHYTTTTNKPVATLSVATNERWKDGRGQLQERVEWHRVTCWGELGVNVHKYLAKGSLVRVVGRLQSRKYDDKEGREVRVWEIIAQEVNFLSRKPDGPDAKDRGPDLPAGDAPPAGSDENLPF